MKDTIEAVLADKNAFGEAVQPPAASIAIEIAQAKIKLDFDAELPDDFISFLKITNGIDFNGAVLYGVGQTDTERGPGEFWQGIVETNTLWREGGEWSDVLIIGETDMDLFAVDLNGLCPHLQDKVGGDVIEEFVSVAEGIETIFRARL